MGPPAGAPEGGVPRGGAREPRGGRSGAGRPRAGYSVSVTNEKRPLLDAVRRGRARATGLAGRPERYVLLDDEGPVDGATLARELEEAIACLEGPLPKRERARVQLRAMAQSGSAPYAERARAHLARLKAIEQAEFGPLRARLRAGSYPPSALRRDLDARPFGERDLFVDRLLSIYDPPLPDKRPDLENSPYHGSSIDELWPLLERLSPSDVVFDLGSGLGKVPFLVRYVSGARAIGVEYDPVLADAAEAARRELGLEVELIAADARTVDYTDGTFFYLFEPFRGAVLAAVLAQLGRVAERHPIQIAARWVSTPPFQPAAWMTELEALGPIRLFRSSPLDLPHCPEG